MKRKACFAAFILLVASHLSTLAWSKGGHMIVAAVAFYQLSDNDQDAVMAILEEHPSYESWVRDHAKPANAHIGRDVFIFMRAALWADDIRSGSHPQRSNHEPTWHYVNYPLKPTAYDEEDPIGGDILQAIADSVASIADDTTDGAERAMRLSWLIHLVGDLHQPMHAVALVNSTYPSGDKGGNDFYIRPATKAVKLHSFWDGLLGTSSSFRAPHNNSIRLLSQNPRSSFGQLSSDSREDWAKESRLLAIDNCYKKFDLNKGSQSDPSPVPSTYTKDCKAIAEKQAVLAGYRLADLISANLP